MEDQSTLASSCDVKGADPRRVAGARAHLLEDGDYARLADVFRALADTSRARIVHCLLGQELCTCDLAAVTGLSEPAVSQHLRMLRELGLVKTRREGRMVFYSLADAHVSLLYSITLEHLYHQEDPGVVLASEPAAEAPRRSRDQTTVRRGTEEARQHQPGIDDEQSPEPEQRRAPTLSAIPRRSLPYRGRGGRWIRPVSADLIRSEDGR